jgi:hypothetical protein
MDGGELAQSAADDSVAARTVGAGLHAIAVPLPDDMQVGQMRDPYDRRFGCRRARHPVEHHAPK